MKAFLNPLSHSRGKVHAQGSTEGAILLEVVLAVLLFAAAGAIIAGAMSASLASFERVRSGVQAENLAISVLSQVQMGILPPSSFGPEVFDPPFTGWTWEVQVEPVGQTPFEEAEPSTRVEVIIRRVDGPTVRRLAQWVNIPKASETSSFVSAP